MTDTVTNFKGFTWQQFWQKHGFWTKMKTPNHKKKFQNCWHPCMGGTSPHPKGARYSSTLNLSVSMGLFLQASKLKCQDDLAPSNSYLYSSINCWLLASCRRFLLGQHGIWLYPTPRLLSILHWPVSTQIDFGGNSATGWQCIAAVWPRPRLVIMIFMHDSWFVAIRLCIP
jgi:hypothetical protein